LKNIQSKIIAKSVELGFLDIGFAPVYRLEDEARKLEKWLSNNNHGNMHYMENHFDKRIDPSKLVEGAKTVISLSYNYYSDKEFSEDSLKISKYAYGRDYHKVIKKKLLALFEFIQDEIGEVYGRCFVDSAPVMDKVWGEKSGIGWIGKNTNLISKQKGSFFFLAEIILDYDFKAVLKPKIDHCGTCTRCIDYCPTKAIIEPYQVDGSRCISYLTIELKDELIPKEFNGKMDNWMFGCDVCQDVCPWNRFSIQNEEEDFAPSDTLFELSKKDWEDLNEEAFNIIFQASPVKRTKFQGLKRNIKFTLQQ
jgi:epoxyqueuosine reductase